MTRSEEAVLVLREARKLVARPYGWMKGGSSGYTLAARRLDPDHGSCVKCVAKSVPMVESYCATGAVSHVVGRDYETLVYKRVIKVLDAEVRAIIKRDGLVVRRVPVRPLTRIMWYNDRQATTKRDVLALFDGAIARAAQGG